MSLSAEMQAAIGAARQNRAGLKHMAARLSRRTGRARRLFLDQDGNVTDDAAALFADIAREAGMNRRGFVPDAELRLFRDGGQHIVRYIIDLLAINPRQIDTLHRKLEGIEHGRQ